ERFSVGVDLVSECERVEPIDLAGRPDRGTGSSCRMCVGVAERNRVEVAVVWPVKRELIPIEHEAREAGDELIVLEDACVVGAEFPLEAQARLEAAALLCGSSEQELAPHLEVDAEGLVKVAVQSTPVDTHPYPVGLCVLGLDEGGAAP